VDFCLCLQAANTWGSGFDSEMNNCTRRILQIIVTGDGAVTPSTLGTSVCQGPPKHKQFIHSD